MQRASSRSAIGLSARPDKLYFARLARRAVGTASRRAPMRPSQQAAILWLVVAYFVCGPLERLVPGPVEGFFANGPPKWRCIWAMPTQVLVFPPAFVLARRRSRSMKHWCAEWARTQGGEWSWLFAYVFPAFLLIDFAITHVRPMLTLHHITCLVGHYVGTFAVREAFPYYFAGVVALELGSAGCNLFCYYPSFEAFYLIATTASNIITLLCTRRWCQTVDAAGRVRRGAPRTRRATVSVYFGGALTLGLVAMRQKEAYRCWTGHSQSM